MSSRLSSTTLKIALAKVFLLQFLEVTMTMKGYIFSVKTRLLNLRGFLKLLLKEHKTKQKGKNIAISINYVLVPPTA